MNSINKLPTHSIANAPVEADCKVRGRNKTAAATLSVLALAVLAACGGSDGAASEDKGAAYTNTPGNGAYDAKLAFDKSAYTTISLVIDGVATPVRYYKEICYVSKPTALASTQPSGPAGTFAVTNPCGYQSMNVFVPESVASSSDAPIYFLPNNAGWMGGYIGMDGGAAITPGASYASASNAVGAAIKNGFVIASIATRGRGLTGADGVSYPGKAPAAVVDAKAAIRYLRLNDSVMPGNANHIIINSTSGGGALASIVGASGNSSDYLTYLADVGAAGVDSGGKSTLRDDVLAITAYCPITDLGNADVIYEWLFNVLNTRATVNRNPNPTGSATLMAKFPAYQASLGLKNSAGAALTANNALEELRQEVSKSAEAYMAAGGTIPSLGGAFTLTTNSPSGSTSTSYPNDWIAIDQAAKKVLSIDLTRYLAYVATQATLKAAPAFDATGLTIAGNAGETNMFGTTSRVYSNFTEYSWMNNDIAGDNVGYADTGLTSAQYIALPTTVVTKQVDLLNPMKYIAATSSTTTPYWYIRNGTRDRDTAALVSINLARALAADTIDVKDVNYAMAWNQPHGGNYDVPEAMAWIAKILADAKAKGI